MERLLGQGGMGSVWAGRHITLGHFVAIKFIHPALTESREALRRFDIEAKAAARIKSRHAAAVHDHGVTPEGRPYIVMEYLEGEPLEEAIRRRGALPLREVAEIVAQAARALEVAHNAGIVHRDLKPDNIFLAHDREAANGYTVKLVDFGIAKIVHDEAATGSCGDAGRHGARNAALHEPGGADRGRSGERGFRHLVARGVRVRGGLRAAFRSRATRSATWCSRCARRRCRCLPR